MFISHLATATGGQVTQGSLSSATSYADRSATLRRVKGTRKWIYIVPYF